VYGVHGEVAETAFRLPAGLRATLIFWQYVRWQKNWSQKVNLNQKYSMNR